MGNSFPYLIKMFPACHDHFRFRTSSTDGSHHTSQRSHHHLGACASRCTSVFFNNGAEHFLLTILRRFCQFFQHLLIKGCLFGMFTSHFYDFTHHRQGNLCRRLCSDRQSDGCMKGLHQLRCKSGFHQFFFHKERPFLRSHHANISMGFLKNFQQAFLIKPMSSGHTHKIVIPAARHLPQKFCIVATEHLISSFSSGVLCKKGPVFQHHNLKIQKLCHADQCSSHIPGSADHKFYLLSQGLHKYFLPVYPLKSFSTQLPDAGLCKKCTLSALHRTVLHKHFLTCSRSLCHCSKKRLFFSVPCPDRSIKMIHSIHLHTHRPLPARCRQCSALYPRW